VIDWWLGGPMGPDGHLVWVSPRSVVVGVVAVALVAWVASLLGQRSWRARASEAVCWGIALAALSIALAGPLWVEEEGRTEPGRVAVLVDSSRSMSIVEESLSRGESALKILENIDAEDVDVYHFGDDLAVGPPGEFNLPGTDIEGALDALSERVAGEKLAGVVVISDGLDRGLLRRRFLRDENPAPPSVPGPLTVFGVGSANRLRDLAVRDVSVGGYAFLRTPFRITSRLKAVGFDGQTVSVTLEQDGATVSQKRVKLDDEGNADVVFEVIPDRPGRFTYAVSVPVYEGDAVPSNNLAPVVVRVVRDKIRVLQVAGAPSWEVKFQRRFLKGDPSVDLVSFFILRTPRDITGEYRDQELSLIQFPYKDLFQRDLWSFDIVIFENFDYQPYFAYQSTTLLGNVARYVEEEGRALVMIGGDRSFGLGKYGSSPLADVLPVKISDQGETVDAEPFKPTLTDEGRRHPITRLTPDAAENDLWWERLHPLDGTNVVLGATDDAAVLLEHPTRKSADGKPLPILAVREAGKGRTMALMVDSSWRWSLSEAAEGRGNQAYLRFWKNAMRWLMDDPSTSRVTVDTPRENYAIGDEVRVVIRARDPGFAPLEDAVVKVEVITADGRDILDGETGPEGEAVIPFEAKHRGAHRVNVEVLHGGASVGAASTVFAVTTRDPEVDEVASDIAFLRWMASASDGRYHDASEGKTVVRDPEAGRVVFDRRETPLWRAPLLAFCILLFGGLAWIIRRLSGLR
jgi:uncharacterized membrane protein